MMAAGLINTLINSKEKVVLNSPLFKGIIEPIRDDFDDCYYLTFFGHGVECRFSREGQLKTIYFFGNEEEDSGKFKGDLPLSLNFNYGMAEVHTLLGDPQNTNSDYKKADYEEEEKSWDLYHFDDYSINIEYLDSKNGINMVTVMSPDTAPYK